MFLAAIAALTCPVCAAAETVRPAYPAAIFTAGMGADAADERSAPGSGSDAAGYRWRGSPADSPDLKGLTADIGYFLAYQVVVIGLLYVAPEDVSGWSDESKESFSLDDWEDNVSNPHRDEDDFYINYLLHPYWGATYYVRGRERGLGRAESVAFSALLSTLFEYSLEALFEQPSYQDLWVTPVIGSLLGEYWFTPMRERIRARRGDLDWWDKTLLLLTDPLGVVGAETGRAIGLQTDLRFRIVQSGRHGGTSIATGGAHSHANAHGAYRDVSPAWGLQMRIRW